MKGFKYSSETDKKWQARWSDTSLYRFDESKTENKFYLLEMFSYPSGKTLHAGHWWNYGLSDSYGRFRRMRGCNLFHPPGFDAFGLPAENYAIKTGKHPADSTEENIAVMERQFRAMGTTCDWNYEVVTCREDYYRWTQWLFLKLFERKLACRREAPVNWCPSCRTVLANEQAAGGVCERCESSVVRREMTQWFFRITEYAEELLDGLDKLDWPEKTKTIQKNWIGRSTGAEIDFPCGGGKITVFTTRPDTLMGVTYLALSPEHPAVGKLTTPEHAGEVAEYREAAAKRSEIERMSASAGRDKTGVFTGAYALHPISGEMIPVWVADYVLAGSGTGALMAVPAHDERDYTFAEKFGLPIRRVISEKSRAPSPLPFCGDGVLIRGGEYDGLSSAEAREKITAALAASGDGRPAVKYRLRDWLVSRQRYWGTPIPIIYCENCGTVPVPERDLPVRLPHDVEFLPGGASPLAGCAAFVNTACPVCGRPARRETDTLDTFVCSSWYYLRFYDNKNSDAPFDKARVREIMPVDKYVGGVEHASMHLLYARFITKALRDMGYLDFGEPFPSLFHQGIITGEDGKKMSKRSGAVSPDAIIEKYGSDVFRMFLGFGFSYEGGGPWNDDGIAAIAKFAARVGRLTESFVKSRDEHHNSEYLPDDAPEYSRNQTIKQVSADLESFRFNTAIARIMEYTGAISDYQRSESRNVHYEETLIKDLILLLAPLAPHLSEELWEYIGGPYSVHSQPYPVCDESKLIKKMMKIAVQVNGSLREVIEVECGADEDEIRAAALSRERVSMATGGRQVKKIIYIKGKLINFVC